MRCPKCNKKIDDDSVFCEFCGVRIERVTHEEIQSEEPSESKKTDVSETSGKGQSVAEKVLLWAAAIAAATGILFAIIK